MGNKVSVFYQMTVGLHIVTQKEYATLTKKEIMYPDSFKSLLLLLSTLFFSEKRLTRILEILVDYGRCFLNVSREYNKTS